MAWRVSPGEKMFQYGSYSGPFKASHPLHCLALWSCTAGTSNNFVFKFFVRSFSLLSVRCLAQWSISPLPQTLPFKEAVQKMKEQNFNACKEVYEKTYGIPLSYTTKENN